MTDNELLQEILKEQRIMREEQRVMREEQRVMQEQLSAVDKKVDAVDEKVESVNKLLENDIRPSIQKIAEGHAGLSEKLGRIDDMADDIDEIKGSMVALEAAIMKNSKSIIEIKKAQG